MFFKKFARPNKKIRFSRMITSVGRSQCVHANGFIVLKLVATTLGKIRSTLFRYFACSVNSALGRMRNFHMLIIGYGVTLV